MARATNIYLVMDFNNNILAAFTVKYESQGWAQGYVDHYGGSLDLLKRYRIKDGGDDFDEPANLIECPWGIKCLR